MALSDRVKKLADALNKGETTRKEAVERLIAETGGGLTHAGADDVLSKAEDGVGIDSETQAPRKRWDW